MNVLFLSNNVLLGSGLAMDAFSVSVTNGLVGHGMRRRQKVLIAGTFAFFQFLMPVIGWFCVNFAARFSSAFRKGIPWIAMLLLFYIGGSMLYEAVRKPPEEEKEKAAGSGDGAPAGPLTWKTLLIQGIATSIDAFSVGFAIAGHGMAEAFAASGIIGIVTFIFCAAGVQIGEVFGDIVGSRASIAGGILLIVIGIEIFAGSF